jgi:hypothetical protein
VRHCVCRRDGERGGGLLDTSFPVLNDAAPLTYTLAIKACTTANVAQRPTFAQLRELLVDLVAEVASGSYMSSAGEPVVRAPACFSALPVRDCAWLSG